MALLKTLGVIIAVGFFLGGLGSLLLNLEAPNREALSEHLSDNPISAGVDIASIGIGYDYNTPAFRPCTHIFEEEMEDGACFGDEKKVTWMVEDIPFPDSKDMIYLVPLWFLFAWIIRTLWKTEMNPWTVVLVAVLLFTLGTLLVWIGMRTFLYYNMLSSAEDLGIKEAVIQAREDVVSTTQQAEAAGPVLLTITAVMSVVLAWSMMGGKDD